MATLPNTVYKSEVPQTKEVSSPGVLLLGEPGNGKTFSIATLAKHPHIRKVFYIYTDPGGDESLIDAFQFYNAPIEKLHLRYIAPASMGWGTLSDLVTKVNTMGYETIAGLKAGINKQDHRQMFNMVDVLANFSCERTGEMFGAVDLLPRDCVVVFDSLTGLNKLARDATVGAKPTLHQGEWGVAMSMEENFIRKFVSDIKCLKVMIGHLDKQQDSLTGRMMFSVSLLGNKLAPQIPHMFSDVIYAYREGKNFFWSNTDDRISLKSRNLPIGEKLKPSFEPIIDKWLARIEFMKQIPKEDTSTSTPTSTPTK